MLTIMSTRHRVAGHLIPVQHPEPLDRHPVARDAEERTSPVGGGRVHGYHEAVHQADDEEVLEQPPSCCRGWSSSRPRSRTPRRASRTGTADEGDREQDVDDHREQRRRPERQLRVADGVLVLGGKGGADVDAPRRPAHQPQPDERELEPAPRQARDRSACSSGWRCRSCRSGTAGSSSRTAGPSAGRRRRSRTSTPTRAPKTLNSQTQRMSPIAISCRQTELREPDQSRSSRRPRGSSRPARPGTTCSG